MLICDRVSFLFLFRRRTSVTIPRPVCETVVWSLTSKFKIWKKKNGLTDRGMATGVKKTQSVKQWYGLWHSGAKCVSKKTSVWQTVVWPLGLKKPGLTDRGVATEVTKFRMASGGLKGFMNQRISRVSQIFFGFGSSRNYPSFTSPFPAYSSQIALPLSFVGRPT